MGKKQFFFKKNNYIAIIIKKIQLKSEQSQTIRNYTIINNLNIQSKEINNNCYEEKKIVSNSKVIYN